MDCSVIYNALARVTLGILVGLRALADTAPESLLL